MKLVLDIYNDEIEEDFELFAIKSADKEHVIAWHINRALSIDFIKQKPKIINFKKNISYKISYFSYIEEYTNILLINNIAEQITNEKNSNFLFDSTFSFLIDELKKYEYLLKVETFNEKFLNENLTIKLSDISCISDVQIIPLNKLKSIQNLIFD